MERRFGTCPPPRVFRVSAGPLQTAGAWSSPDSSRRMIRRLQAGRTHAHLDDHTTHRCIDAPIPHELRDAGSGRFRESQLRGLHRSYLPDPVNIGSSRAIGDLGFAPREETRTDGSRIKRGKFGSRMRYAVHGPAGYRCHSPCHANGNRCRFVPVEIPLSLRATGNAATRDSCLGGRQRSRCFRRFQEESGVYGSGMMFCDENGGRMYSGCSGRSEYWICSGVTSL